MTVQIDCDGVTSLILERGSGRGQIQLDTIELQSVKFDSVLGYLKDSLKLPSFFYSIKMTFSKLVDN